MRLKNNIIQSFQIILSFILISIMSIYPPASHADTYTYDSIGRLSAVIYDDGSAIRYSYDKTGNLLERSVQISLAHAITTLQVLADIEPASPIYKELDVNGDVKLGTEEVVYIMQSIAGLR